jgi:hypothetical protein
MAVGGTGIEYPFIMRRYYCIDIAYITGAKVDSIKGWLKGAVFCLRF